MTATAHPHPNELLGLHFGEASPGERKRTEAHVSACEECRAHLQMLEATVSALAAWPDEDPPKGVLDRVRARVGAPPPPLHRREWFLPALQLLLGVAAGCWVIYLGGARLVTLPAWQRVEWLAPFRMLPGIGVAALMFFAIGSLVTLAVAPVLILELRRSEH